MPGFYAKGLLGAVLAGVLAGLVTAAVSHKVLAGWVIAAVLVAFAIMLVSGILKRRRTTYIVTSQRLTIRSGLLSRELHETRLDRVQNVNSSQTVLERVLRVGNVDFDTAASAEYDFTFRGISHPHELVRMVDRALRELTRLS